MNHVFICDAVRTPIGRYGGALASVRTDDLAAIPLKALLERNPKLDPSAIEEVLYGCANGACVAAPPMETVYISKGWNIIALPGPGGIQGGTCNQAQFDQWAFFWWYPEWGRYITLDEANTLRVEIQQKLLRMSFWAHSPEDCELGYYVYGDYYNISELPMLYDDWNMVQFTNDMFGTSINKIKNDCDLLASFKWNGVTQEWNEYRVYVTQWELDRYLSVY